MIIFKYKEESLGKGVQKIKRPVADIYLKTKSNSWIEFHPYIDSGADLTMIPLSLGRLIGLRLDEKKVEQIGGIRGSVPVMNAECKMRIGDQEIKVRIAWALIEDVPPLLGRTDVFDVFEIIFRQKDDAIILREY